MRNLAAQAAHNCHQAEDNSEYFEQTRLWLSRFIGLLARDFQH